jgi:hypothetical protein
MATPRDIFVDNDIAKNFANPLDPHYKDFIYWLQKKGCLVISNKILVEYGRTCSGCSSLTNILAIISHLQKDNRLIKITNDQLKEFVFPSKVERKLHSHVKDHDHIKTVILSFRKYAISREWCVCHDINNYPGHNARAARRPQDIPYN